jgi:hypothetical protein
MLRPMVVVAWVATGAAILELCAREVARRSIVARLTNYTPGTFALLLVVALVVVVLTWTPAAGHWRRGERTALLFSALFAVGLAFQLQLGARLQSDGFY